MQALTLGLHLLARGADPSLTRATDSLRGKIAAALPGGAMAGAGDDTWVFPGAEALTAWCETKADARSFRVDRIGTVTLAGQTFADAPGSTLADWRRLHPGPG